MDILTNIKEIRLKKNMTQLDMASFLNIDTTLYNKIEKGKQDIKFKQVEIIATCFDMSVVDLITYPDKYVDVSQIESDKVSVTFEVSADKKALLLGLIKS